MGNVVGSPAGPAAVAAGAGTVPAGTVAAVGRVCAARAVGIAAENSGGKNSGGKNSDGKNSGGMNPDGKYSAGNALHALKSSSYAAYSSHTFAAEADPDPLRHSRTAMGSMAVGSHTPAAIADDVVQ